MVLHDLGGLALLRRRRRREFGVLMFHSFHEEDRPGLDAICEHIARHYEPVSMSAVAAALNGGPTLPDNAITVTIDDGYHNFLDHGHPVFWRHRIPTTLYAVAGFCEGQLWLWPDQVEFLLKATASSGIRVEPVQGDVIELPLRTPAEKAASIETLTEALKLVPNARRLAFLKELETACAVELPTDPPVGRGAMNWDELRAVAAQGTEIGCHTETHPILSRVGSQAELDSEIRGAKEHLESRLGFEVRHFCYPNGRPIDVGEAVVQTVRNAGYASAVCCTFSLNTLEADRFQIHRTPFDSDIDLKYGKELLAGLHL